MPDVSPPEFVDPDSAPTHARGRWFVAVLLGVWPLAIVAGAVAVAFGAPTKISIACALVVALAIDFLAIVGTFEVDDGDIQHLAE